MSQAGAEPRENPEAVRLTADDYTHVLAAETYRPYACRAHTHADFVAWQEAFRPYLRELIGINRIAARGVCELLPVQSNEEVLDDHVRETWSIQSEPGYRVPFYVLRPKNAAGPRPLVLTPHGHGKAGKRTYAGIADTEEGRKQIDEGQRDIALQAVREGYVAIAPDIRGFGELRRQEDLTRDATSSCRALQARASLFGRTLVGERVWDIGRLIDYAATRTEVDTSRIAITGNSGGGTVSLFAAACDERITVAAPGSYFCTFEDSIGSIIHCECNYVPGILAAAEMYDVAGLIAPRPFMAIAGRQDPIFPYAGVQRAFDNLQRIYAVAGAPGSCRLSIGEGGHRYYKADVWPFIRQLWR